ncbi:MAG: endonuclease/exonuclease/phosphatase family protein [Candidatus Kerfeldbacteria bacterium]
MNLIIASINFWGLPWPLSINKNKRLNNLIAIIKQYDFDVVAMQEMWLTYDINKIKKFLPSYHVTTVNNTFFNFSGLVTLTKLKVNNKAFLPFTKLGLHKEFFTKKGLLSTEIKINNQAIKILNTHLFFPRSKKQDKTLNLQLSQLNKYLGNNPTILSGDFNTKYSLLNLKPNYKNISNIDGVSLDINNKFSTRGLNIINEDVICPDIIIANFNVSIVRNQILKKPIISDHYMTTSEININSVK